MCDELGTQDFAWSEKLLINRRLKFSEVTLFTYYILPILVCRGSIIRLSIKRRSFRNYSLESFYFSQTAMLARFCKNGNLLVAKGIW